MHFEHISYTLYVVDLVCAYMYVYVYIYMCVANSYLLSFLPAPRICLVAPGVEGVARCVVASQAHHALRNSYSCEINSAVLN